MRFTLKDYQADAVAEVLNRLGQAREIYHGRYSSTSAFSLSAVTGAGKTVMAAAVIEALFEGNDDYDFEADPGAVVLWFTDDPALNEQTRYRLMEASDLASSRLNVIPSTFQAERLEPGNVYFLNAQKLGRNSLLVRGAPSDADDALPTMPAAPDLRANTMWDILRNTIEDERLTLYLVLDEAHKGMRPPSSRDRSERQTIVRRLIDGAGGTPPIPIVWGISATVQRFEDAMHEASVGGQRTRLASVEVDAARVRESGLLKDDIRLDFPAESGRFDTTLLTRAVRRTREAGGLWREYAAAQDPPLEPVVPLLVVQMPNTPSDELLLEAFRSVHEAWPGLPDDALAHVFGDHRTIEIGGFTVPHIAPEKVQESTWVRVLFAKDAISTGWDCPRAEVLMSFRPAEDETHITQLLGRMVRTPLARRVPGDDRLNAVECLLPRFDTATAVRVGERLVGSDGGVPAPVAPRTLFAPVDLAPNPQVPEAVWAAFDALPSQTLPRRVARPVKRLMALAQALSQDGLLPGARRAAYQELCAVLDGQAARHRAQVDAARRDVQEMSGETIVAGMSGTFATELFVEQADVRAIEADFQAAGRVLTRDLAGRYAEHVLDRMDEEDYLEAHLAVAALARVPGVAAEVDREAEALTERWFAEHRVAIRGLSDGRRAAYDEIRAMAAAPVRIDLLRPRVRSESTQDATGRNVLTRPRHLMSDEAGACPVPELNDWEVAVLDRELARGDALAWYRNPSRASADSLAVAYRDELGQWRRMCPDFVFFHGDEASVKVSIVDPHGIYLRDAIAKLRGLAAFAETYGDDFHRIEAVAEVGGKLRVLDLLDEDTRSQLTVIDSAEALYASRVASDY